MHRLYILLLLPSILFALRIKFTAESLPEKVTASGIRHIFSSFLLSSSNIAIVDALLRYDRYYFGQHCYHTESTERQKELEAIVNETLLHKTLLNVPKILSNENLARYIFMRRSHVYEGNLLAQLPLGRQQASQLSFSDRELWRAVIKYAVQNQLDRMQTLDWLASFLEGCQHDEFIWIFNLLSPQDMIPEFLTLFLQSPRMPGAKDPEEEQYVNPISFLYEHFWKAKGFLNDEELLVRLLVLVLAIRNIDNYQYKVRKLIPDGIRSREIFQQVDFWDIEHSYLLKILEGLSKSRADRAFWAGYANVICLNGNFPDPDGLYLNLRNSFLESASMYLSPLHVRKIIYTNPTIKINWLEMAPILGWNLPKSLLSPLNRRILFLHDGPLVASNVAIEYIPREDFDSFLYRMVKKAFKHGTLPQGLHLQDPLEFKSFSFSKLLIERSNNILRTGEAFNITSQGGLYLLLIIATIPYLIAKSIKLDMSSIFTPEAPLDNWNAYKSWMTNLWPQQGFTASRLLQTLRINVYFSPVELRRMIDSSFSLDSTIL